MISYAELTTLSNEENDEDEGANNDLLLGRRR